MKDQTDQANAASEESEAAIDEGFSENWQPIIDLLRRATGIDFSCYRVGTVGRRILRRMELLQIDDLNDYIIGSQPTRT